MSYLSPELAGTLRKESLFEDASKLTGEIFREVETRRTLRFQVGSKNYFVKVHYGVGWREIFKNLLQLRLPVLGAKNEWLAINRLTQLGVNTLTPVAYVSEGKNPAKIRSCIITKALENTRSLEDLVNENAVGMRLRRKLVGKLAEIARTMHNNGINHRDFYICHFLLERTSVNSAGQIPEVFLIDLHRAQVRTRTPDRWRIKDISGLLFSGIDAGVTRTDLFRFMKDYSGKSLRETLNHDLDFWNAVLARARKLYVREHGTQAAGLLRLGR